jgi:hypothetical protein
MCRAQFENDGAAIYAAINKSLRKGSPYALQVVSDRAYGKLRETHQLDVGQYPYHDMSTEDLEKRIAELNDKLGMTALENENAELNSRLAELERRIGIIHPESALPQPTVLKPI